MPDTSKSKDIHFYLPNEENEALEDYIQERYNGCPPPKAQVIRHLISVGIEQERKKIGVNNA